MKMLKLFGIQGGRFCTLISTIVALSAAHCVFADDAYIESDGTQFMNTGYYPGPKTKIEVDFQLTEAIKGKDCIFGNYGDANFSVLLYAQPETQSKQFQFCGKDGGWQAQNSGVSIDTERHTMVIDVPKKKGTMFAPDGTVQGQADFIGAWTYTKTAAWPIAFFASCNNASGTTARQGAKVKIYGAKIWESEDNGETYTLLHDYSPTVKGGVAGLLDSQTDTFLYDTRAPGAGAFAYGGDIKTVADDGYVESDGNEFVNSRYHVNPATKIEVDYAFTDATTAQQRIWGMDGEEPQTSIYVQNSLNIAIGFGDTFVNSDTQTGIKADTARHTAVIDVVNKRAAFITGVTTNWSNNAILDTHVPTKTARRPIGLFGNLSNVNGTGSDHRAKVRIYRARFWTGDELVHDYVPCIQGGIVGLKDNVDGAFVTAEGAGELTAGGNIAEEAGPGYIANGRAAYLDTGHTPTPHTRVEVDYLCMDDHKDWRIFGSFAGGKLYMNHYVNGGQNYAWSCMDGNGNWETTGIRVYTKRRRTFILDPHTDFVGLVTAGYTNYTAKVSTVSAGKGGTYVQNGGRTLKLFADGDANNMTDLRLYGCRIFEAGELVRDYIPYVMDGVAGLYDRENKTFTGSANDAVFTYGGDITIRQDAYVESTGTQGINLNYFMKGKESRVEADFAFTDVLPLQARVFGQDSGGGLLMALYINGSGNINFGFGNTFINNHGPMGVADTKRHTAVIDGYHDRLYYVTGSVTNNNYDISGDAHSNNASWPMGVFATPDNQSATKWRNGAKMKLYSLRIYEKDLLKHQYLPYMKDGKVGLYDTEDKVPLFDARNSATPFTMSGRGVDGAEKWLITPQNCSVAYGKSVTLSANASGAKSYKWTKNGEAVEGGANGELTVSWERGGTTIEYTVTPVYDVLGVATDGEPKTVEVTNEPLGLMIIVR